MTIIETDPKAPAPSPFLPNSNIEWAWDSTALGLLKTCPRLYQYTMIEGWAARNENIHLRWGSELHKALEDFDHARADGADHEEALRLTTRQLLERIYDWEPEPEQGRRSQELKTKPALVRTVIWYLEHYRNDAAKTMILENGQPATEFSFQLPFDYGPAIGIAQAKAAEYMNFENCEGAQPYVLCGHLDKVVEFQGALYAMDHKTTTTTPGSYYFDQFDPNNQMTLYTFAAQIIFHSPVKGVIIDAIQIADEWSRPVRSFTYRTPDQIDEWMRDLRVWLDRAEDYASHGYWPMNDTACSMYGGCKFRGVCSKSPQVREQFLKSSFVQLEESERWNPAKPR